MSEKKHNKDEQLEFDEATQGLGETSDENLDDLSEGFDYGFEQEGFTDSNENEGFDEFSLDDDMDDGVESVSNKKSSGKSGLMDLVKANLIYIIGGIAVGGFALYMIMGILFPSTPKQQRPEQAQTRNFGMSTHIPGTEQPKAAPRQVHKVTGQPALPANSYVMNQSDFTKLLQGFQGVVEKQTQSLTRQLEMVRKDQNQVNRRATENINSLAKQVLSITHDMSTLEQQIKAVNASVQKQQRTINQVTMSLKKTQQQLGLLIAQKAANMQKLTLRAVVPGRAWLVDGAGNTISVTTGNELPYYGKVTKINSDKGQVIMSSGYVFK